MLCSHRCYSVLKLFLGIHHKGKVICVNEWYYYMLIVSGKKVVLITGSPALTVSRVASVALGADWKDLFDVIVYKASKPGFFREVRPFRTVSPSTARDTPFDLSLSKEYSGGSWALLRKALLPHTSRAVYIGI
jgi:5' nucleotidase family